MSDFVVGTAIGIQDKITGREAVAIIYDGDSVFCTFHGTNSIRTADLVRDILNEQPAFIRRMLIQGKL